MKYILLLLLAQAAFLLSENLKINRLPTTLDLYNESSQEVTWSILICTVDERAELFSLLYKKLIYQIETAQLQHKIEVIFYKDNKEQSVGFKRNALINNARGKYISFIDDDDDISQRYIELIYLELLKDPDCVSLKGVVSNEGKDPHILLHSNTITDYYRIGNVYYRPPTHLNPMRKSIAQQFQFPNISFGEDSEWVRCIVQSGLLITEEEINIPYYFYRFSPNTSLTQGLKK